MKNIFQMFLPFFIFLFLTIILFFYLKNEDFMSQKRSTVKEIFKDVNVEKSRDKIRTGISKVTRIRWHQHDGFERLVLDVSDYNAGNFKMGVDAYNDTKLHGFLTGYRYFSQTLPSFGSSAIVKNMEVYTQSKNDYSFTLFLHRPTEYKVFALSNPSRIVIDMY